MMKTWNTWEIIMKYIYGHMMQQLWKRWQRWGKTDEKRGNIHDIFWDLDLGADF